MTYIPGEPFDISGCCDSHALRFYLVPIPMFEGSSSRYLDKCTCQWRLNIYNPSLHLHSVKVSSYYKLISGKLSREASSYRVIAWPYSMPRAIVDIRMCADAQNYIHRAM